MFHVAAFDSSIATGTVLVDCKSITDAGMMTVSGDGYVMDKRFKLMIGAYAFGANLTRAQLQLPKFNLLAYQEISPLVNTAPGAGQKPQFNSFLDGPRAIDETEVLIAQVIQAGGLAENDIVGVWLADAPIVPVKAEHFTIRFTGATTLTAAAWTTVTPTLDRNLPKGRYSIIGARLKSATGILFRVRLPGFAVAPGGVCAQSDLANDIEGQRHGGWGDWGDFDQNLLPTFDVLATAADTAQSGEMDLVKLGA